MTKSELVEHIAGRLPHLPRQKLERMVNAVFEAMVTALQREERIEIRGFGSFAVRVREAREARNPRTGEKVQVPRRLTPTFTAGKELRDRLNRNLAEGLAADGSAVGIAQASIQRAPEATVTTGAEPSPAPAETSAPETPPLDLVVTPN